MKNFLSLASITIITIAILSGCGKNPHTERIRQIDSLLVEMDQIEKTLHAADTASMNSILRHQVENINFIQRSADTLPRETAFLVDEYARYKKAYAKWGAKMPAFYSELLLRKQQLENLRNDLEKNLIEEQNANTFYDTEAMHVRELEEIVHQMDSGLTSIQDDMQRSEAQIMEVIDKMKSDSAR